jgi:hypothetical protein
MIRKEIAYDYLTSWLFLDLLASFPYEWAIDGCIGLGCNNADVIYALK